MPDLNSKHKGFSRHSRDSIRSGIVSIDCWEAGADDNFVKGVNDFVVEGDEKKNDDAEGEQSSEDGSVLWFFPVPEQFCSVEEVHLVQHILHVSQKSHRYYL